MTQDELKRALDYEPGTGVFRWKVVTGKARVGAVAGTDSGGYVLIGFGRTIYKAHRLAWLHVHGRWPAMHLDHINGDRADNRIANLREATRLMNQQNIRKAHADNKVGLLGVCRNGAGFTSRIMVEGKVTNLGTFRTPEQAHSAYLTAKRQLHSGCTI